MSGFEEEEVRLSSDRKVSSKRETKFWRLQHRALISSMVSAKNSRVYVFFYQGL